MSSNAHTEHLVVDIETSAVKDAASYAEEITKAPATYKDPEKIAAYLEKANAEQITKAALDVDLCRIVAIGLWMNDGRGVRAGTADGEDAERAMLTGFWKAVRAPFGLRTIVGHNILDFDLPALQRRSLYLGVPAPHISLDRFRHPNVEDTQQILSYNGKLRYRSLGFFCRRFGITCPVVDEVGGSAIPGLVAMKDWEAIRTHVSADVYKAKALAERLGIIDLPSSDPVGADTQVAEEVPF